MSTKFHEGTGRQGVGPAVIRMAGRFADRTAPPRDRLPRALALQDGWPSSPSATHPSCQFPVPAAIFHPNVRFFHGPVTRCSHARGKDQRNNSYSGGDSGSDGGKKVAPPSTTSSGANQQRAVADLPGRCRSHTCSTRNKRRETAVKGEESRGDGHGKAGVLKKNRMAVTMERHGTVARHDRYGEG